MCALCCAVLYYTVLDKKYHLVINDSTETRFLIPTPIRSMCYLHVLRGHARANM